MKWLPRHTSLVVIALGFLFFAFLLSKKWLCIPVLIAIIGFLNASFGEFIHLKWALFSKTLGRINSYFLLSVIFFLILTPIALLKKFSSKNNFTGNKNILTSFQKRSILYNPKHLKNPW